MDMSRLPECVEACFLTKRRHGHSKRQKGRNRVLEPRRVKAKDRQRDPPDLGLGHAKASMRQGVQPDVGSAACRVKSN